MAQTDITSCGQRLELGVDGVGARHFLAGRGVHAGTLLELLMADGSWLGGRYENQHLTDGYVRTLFFIVIKCQTGQREWANDPASPIVFPQACLELPSDALLRRPR